MARRRGRKPKLKECSYHLCHKKTRGYKCKYCDKFFCRKHLRAKPAGMPRFEGTRPEDLRFMKEYHRKGGHPCAPFLDYWELEHKRERKEYGIALDRLLKPKKRKFEDESYLFKKPVKPFRLNAKHILIGLGILAVIILFLHYGGLNLPIGALNCSDGTLYNQCSDVKPFYCENGTRVLRADICGCPPNYEVDEKFCRKLPTCEDGTLYGKCSANKPIYCDNGQLVNRSSICGCPYDLVEDNNLCVSKYMTEPKEMRYYYYSGHLEFTVYKGLNDYLASLSRSISYSYDPPTDKDFILKSLDESHQKEFLDPLVEEIRGLTSDKDQQAKIAIRLAQAIPYDYEALETGYVSGKYPYEVLYTNIGVCSEKAQLMVYLLRELGYSTAILRFEQEDHDAVGVKCPSQYNYKNTGYCFVEPTQLSSIGDSYGVYVGVGQLKSTPKVITISKGKALESI